MAELSNNKVIAKNAVFLYIRMFIVLVLSLVTVRLILQVLGVEDYGIFNAIGGVVTSMSFISSILSNASQRYFAFEMESNSVEKLKEIFTTICVIYVAISIVVFVILQFGGMWFLHNKMMVPTEKMEIAEIVLTFSMLTFIITIITNPFPALIIAHEEMGLYAMLSIFDAILKFIAVVILFFLSGNHLVIYSVSLFIASIVYIIVCYIICRRKYDEVRIKMSINIDMLKSIMNFSGWTLFGSLANMGYSQGINLMLNVFVGPIANAAFAIGNQVSNAINSLGSGFFSAMRPSMIKSIAKNDNNYTFNLFRLSNKITFYLISSLSIPLLLFTPEILSVWLSDVHEYMVPFTRILLVSILVQNLGMPLTTIAQGANIVQKYHLYVDGFTLLGLPLLLVLLYSGVSPIYVLNVYVVVFCIAHIIRLVVTHQIFKFSIRNYMLDFLIPSLFIFCMVIFVSYELQRHCSNIIISFIIGSVSSICLLTTCVYYILFDKNEREKIISYIKTKI